MAEGTHISVTVETRSLLKHVIAAMEDRQMRVSSVTYNEFLILAMRAVIKANELEGLLAPHVLDRLNIKERE